MGGCAPRAREDSVRPRRLIGASGRPRNFTVRRTVLKGRAILIGLLAGALGLAAGIVCTAWFMSRFLTYAQGTSAVATLVVDGSAIRILQSGDIDAATRLLQSQLDGELITISSEVKAGYTLTPQGQKAIAQIRRLRESSGYEPSAPEVRAAVHDALSLGSDK